MVWPTIWDEFTIGGNRLVSGKSQFQRFFETGYSSSAIDESPHRSLRNHRWQGHELLWHWIPDQAAAFIYSK